MELNCETWINILSHKLRRRMDANMQSLGLNEMQGRVMHFVIAKGKNGPVYQRDVEEVFSMSRSTVTGVLQQMEKNGLITREKTSGDGRLKSLIPTEKALELDGRIEDYICDTEKVLTAGVTGGELAAFTATARRMCANLDG